MQSPHLRRKNSARLGIGNRETSTMWFLISTLHHYIDLQDILNNFLNRAHLYFPEYINVFLSCFPENGSPQNKDVL